MNLLGRPRGRGHFGDAQSRRVRGQDRVIAGSPVQPGKNVELEVDFLGNRFDNQVRMGGCILQIRRRSQTGHGGRCRFRLDLAAIDSLGKITLYPGTRTFQQIRRDVIQNRLKATECGHMGDAAPHDSSADNGNRLHIHPESSRLKRANLAHRLCGS